MSAACLRCARSCAAVTRIRTYGFAFEDVRWQIARVGFFLSDRALALPRVPPTTVATARKTSNLFIPPPSSRCSRWGYGCFAAAVFNVSSTRDVAAPTPRPFSLGELALFRAGAATTSRRPPRGPHARKRWALHG